MNRLPIAPDPIVAALARLHAAGWSVGDFAAGTKRPPN